MSQGRGVIAIENRTLDSYDDISAASWRFVHFHGSLGYHSNSGVSAHPREATRAHLPSLGWAR